MSTAKPTSLDPGPFSAETLKRQAMRASAWTFGGYLSTRLLRLGSNLIIARLLVPEAFGLMAIVAVVVQGLQMFSDIGIGPSIIQNQRGDDPRYLNTAWTIQVIRGFMLWFVACAIAYPATLVYDDMPRLIELIPIAGLSAVINGFNSTSLFTVNRHLDLSKRTILEFSAKAISITVMIVAAFLTRDVWALVIGGLVNALVTMVFSHMLVPGFHNRFQWDREAARDLFRFGRWIFVSTALTFLAMSCDRMLLGVLVAPELLGIYWIAFMWYEMPKQLIQQVSSKVIFPTMSKARELPREEFLTRIERNRARYVPLMMVGLGAMVCFGDLFIEFLYPAEYHAAGWMLVILAIGMWCRILDQTMSPALMVYHKLQYNPIGSVMRFALIGGVMPLAYVHYGMLGALCVIALGDVPNYIAYAWGLSRNGLYLFKQDVRMTLILVAIIGVLLGGRAAVGLGLPTDGASRAIHAPVEAIDAADSHQGGEA